MIAEQTGPDQTDVIPTEAGDQPDLQQVPEGTDITSSTEGVDPAATQASTSGETTTDSQPEAGVPAQDQAALLAEAEQKGKAKQLIASLGMNTEVEGGETVQAEFDLSQLEDELIAWAELHEGDEKIAGDVSDYFTEQLDDGNDSAEFKTWLAEQSPAKLKPLLNPEAKKLAKQFHEWNLGIYGSAGGDSASETQPKTTEEINDLITNLSDPDRESLKQQAKALPAEVVRAIIALNAGSDMGKFLDALFGHADFNGGVGSISWGSESEHPELIVGMAPFIDYLRNPRKAAEGFEHAATKGMWDAFKLSSEQRHKIDEALNKAKKNGDKRALVSALEVFVTQLFYGNSQDIGEHWQSASSHLGREIAGDENKKLGKEVFMWLHQVYKQEDSFYNKLDLAKTG